jgi:predicted component of type VI protein secretion system
MLLRRFYKRKEAAGDLAAIIDNLNHTLNTKKGFGSWLKEYGIGDYNEFRARNKVVETVIREIKENIALFEPRVRLEDIQEVKSDSALRLKFQVKCVFLEHAKPLYIILDSVYNKVIVES